MLKRGKKRRMLVVMIIMITIIMVEMYTFESEYRKGFS